MSITPLPSAPAVTDTTSEFNSKAFNWVAALNPFVTEANALLATCETAAATSGAAIAMVGAVKWVSGTAYAIGDAVYSPIDMQTYRRKTNGGGTTDPSADSTNWTQVRLDPVTATQAEMEAGTESAVRTVSPLLVKQAINAQVPSITNTITAIATGSLSDGSLVSLNSDGTVSVTGEVAASSGSNTQFVSSPYQAPCSSTYDSNANAVVIVYSAPTTGYGTAVVGTVSGNTITFGTPVAFNAVVTNDPQVTFDSTNNKIIVVCRQTTSQLWGYVGTVSDNSISFGAGVNAGASCSSTPYVSLCFDKNKSKVILAYQNSANAPAGYGRILVGTVSGTSISWGAISSFSNGSVTDISIDYEPVSKNIVIAWRDVGAGSSYGTARTATVGTTSISSFGTAVVFKSATTTYISVSCNRQGKVGIFYFSTNASGIVGTISGSDITFGTATDFSTVANSIKISSVYDRKADKFLIAYTESTTNCKYVLGTVSGTSISFGTPTLFRTANIDSNNWSYHSGLSKCVLVNYDYTATTGWATVIQNYYTTNNRFIGISKGSFTNGQTATIQIAGAVAANQTGLETGEKYYIAAAGGLTTATGTFDTYAGMATSATKLLVKG